MKKWKKWLAAGLAVITLNLSGVSIAVNANPFEPYDRSEAVVLEEGQRKKDSDKKPNPKAWQKINGVCYNGSGVAIPGAITRGIDVSEWQGKINWSKVKKSNVDFAMIRIAYGTGYMDKTYAYNMREANAVGMPVGTYVYSTATTKEQALKEAQLVIEKMRGYKVSYPVVFDLEYSKMGELTPSKISELALTFCNEVKRAGYYPMIYCNTYWYSSKIDMSRLSGLDVWIASYGDKIQAPSSSLYDYTIWQATDGNGGGVLNPTKGLIDGIPKDCNVDVNFGYVDYTKKIIPRTEPVSSYVPGDSGEDSGTGKDGWVEKDGKKYYYKNGEPLKGTRKIGGEYYCFDSKDGHLFQNQLLYSASTNRTCYADASGIRVANTWVQTEGKKYYMGADGYAYKGSRNVHGKFYLFDSKRGYAFTNRKRISSQGDIYYYGADGARMNSGFAKIQENGKINTYYFNKEGKAYKQWHKIKGKWYYFYPGWTETSGIMAQNTAITIDGMTYIFDENGVCVNHA